MPRDLLGHFDLTAAVDIRGAFWSSLGICERLPACLGDLHARDFDRASADNHALAVCGGESGAHKLNYLFDSEAMGEQDRLGAAVPTSREQLERAAAVGLGAASDAGHAP
jgi:hypothetical protein